MRISDGSSDVGSSDLVSRLRAARTGEQLAKVRQPAQRRIVAIGRVDGTGDRGQLLGTVRVEQHAQPVPQESPVSGSVGQRKRVEAGRMPGGNAAVSAANAAQEDFGAAILVEDRQSTR